jgi:hypothetical protein
MFLPLHPQAIQTRVFEYSCPIGQQHLFVSGYSKHYENDFLNEEETAKSSFPFCHLVHCQGIWYMYFMLDITDPLVSLQRYLKLTSSTFPE